MIKVVKHSSTHTVKTLVGMTEETLAIHVLADPSSTSFWTLIHFLNGWKILKKMMIVTGKFGNETPLLLLFFIKRELSFRSN
jgi:hypothetical protein